MLGGMIVRILLRWLLNALGLLLVAYLVPGFELSGVGGALLTAVVLGFLNMTVGLVLQLMALPLTLLTFGLFYFVVNAIVLEVASAITPGFHIRSFWSALVGALALMLVNFLLRRLLPDPEKARTL
jgi:putative membrane protein